MLFDITIYFRVIEYYKNKMSNLTNRKLPSPISNPIFFNSNGENYEILKYKRKEGPNLDESEVIAAQRNKFLLRRDDALSIIYGIGNYYDTRIKLERNLNLGDWSYINSSEEISQSSLYAGKRFSSSLKDVFISLFQDETKLWASYLSNSWFYGLDVSDDRNPNNRASALILKSNDVGK